VQRLEVHDGALKRTLRPFLGPLGHVGQTLMTACNIVHKVVQSVSPRDGNIVVGRKNTILESKHETHRF